jgi:excisionase family DNA binding protein
VRPPMETSAALAFRAMSPKRGRGVGSPRSADRSHPSSHPEVVTNTAETRADAIDLPPTISVEHAAKLLGVSRSAAYRAVAAGHLPVLRLGRRIYIPTARLLSMLGVPPEERR